MRPALSALCVLLAACEPALDVDLVLTPPADDARVLLRVDGVDLRRTGGGTETRTRGRTGEFLAQRGHAALPTELLGNSEVGGGEYAGLRLRLADEPGSVAHTGRPIAFIEPGKAGDAAVAFALDPDGEDRVSLVVALDLVLSLSENEDQAGFTLDPLLRAMRRADAASVRGSIPAAGFADGSCSSATSVALVYAFAGQDIVPDERDGSAAEPFAVAPIERDAAAAPGFYRIDWLPPGDYTLAFTCEGQFENGLAASQDEHIDFFDGGQIELEAGEDAVLDF